MIDPAIRKFWEVEELPTKRILTPEESECEQHFLETHTRNSGGRFVVGVPFKEEVKAKLELSRDKAIERFRQIERRLRQKPQLRQQYSEFMREYVRLGHMVKLPPSAIKEIPGETNYIGHHLVLNASSATTKLRVVFHASAKSPTNVSISGAVKLGTKIQVQTPKESWRHVAGVENIADLASRGCSASELANCELWWKGPAWLSKPNKDLSVPNYNEDKWDLTGVNLEEGSRLSGARLGPKEDTFICRYSSLVQLERHTAWYLRYMMWKASNKHRQKLPFHLSGTLRFKELREAVNVYIRKTQAEYYPEDLQLLSNQKSIRKCSPLRSLNPYIHHNGILRVSGRLANIVGTSDRKHQIILPGESHLTKLLVQQCHIDVLHGGFQLTWSTLQVEFWIVRGRDRVRKHVRSCVICRRAREQAAKQLMGAPAARVTPAQPFLHTGVDFAGPFTLGDVFGRVPKSLKVYMCLFVCFSTKAVHLEPVTSLSSKAFLAAFKRFAARRALPAHMYSDCGTNFVGAEKELREFVGDGKAADDIAKGLSESQVQWHVNPPAALHNGGLWEAGVKSAKHHLRRVMGIYRLTFEQFSTPLAQVEEARNSRPLYARSLDPDDMDPLTPIHFLMERNLSLAQDVDVTDIPEARLSNYKRVQKQFQLFWWRWILDYLNAQQQRNKWQFETKNVGDVVLLVQESTTPTNWKTGRVVEIHPGEDDLVRVCTVRTATVDMSNPKKGVMFSLFKRPTHKVVPLIDD